MKRMIVASILFLFLFILIALSMKMNTCIVRFDENINQRMENLRNHQLDAPMSAVTRIGEWYSIISLSAVVIGVLIHKGRKRDALLFAVFMISGFIVEYSLKFLIMRERPQSGLITISGYSFPSGHATMVALLFLLICALYEGEKVRSRSIIVIISILIPVIVGFSRIYLGVHWLSDVIAGYMLAISIYLLFVAVRMRIGLKSSS